MNNWALRSSRRRTSKMRYITSADPVSGSRALGPKDDVCHHKYKNAGLQNYLEYWFKSFLNYLLSFGVQSPRSDFDIQNTHHWNNVSYEPKDEVTRPYHCFLIDKAAKTRYSAYKSQNLNQLMIYKGYIKFHYFPIPVFKKKYLFRRNLRPFSLALFTNIFFSVAFKILLGNLN